MKNIFKKILNFTLCLTILFALASCTFFDSGSTLVFTKLPHPIYVLNAEGSDAETVKKEVEVLFNGDRCTLAQLEERGAIIKGLNFEKPGTKVLVVSFDNNTITYEFEVVSQSGGEVANVLVNSMNGYLTEAMLYVKLPTLYDAFKVLETYGYNETVFYNNELCWNVKTGLVQVQDEFNRNIHNFVVVNSKEELTEQAGNNYSVYLKQTAQQIEEEQTLSVGFDAGKYSGITSVKYTSNVGQEVVIRTNSFETKLTINAPLDSVKHFDYASSVDVIAIKDASYDEFGTVGRVEVKQGHVEAMDGCEIFCLMEAPATDGAVKDTTVNTGAIVHTNMENKNVASDDIVKETDGVANGHFDDCGAGRHSFSQLVVDSEHVYDVCTCCGYTLINVYVEINDTTTGETTTAIIKQSKNELDEQGKVVKENTTPLLVYDADLEVGTATTIVGKINNGEVVNFEIKEDKVISENIDPEKFITGTEAGEELCSHSFVEILTVAPTCISEGIKTFECSRCHANYNIKLPMAAHKYYDNIGNTFTADEKCSVCGHVRGTDVAEMNGKIYKSLDLAISSAPTDGTLTKITLLADDAAELTKDGMWAAWHIKAGQNIELDLAGYTLKDLIKFPKEYYDGDSNNGEYDNTDANNGVFYVAEGAKLTVKDSSCKLSSTDGTGKIYNQLSKETPETLWTSAEYRQGYVNREDDIILSFGEFVLESGTLDCQAPGSICFAIDVQGTSTTTVNGGIVQNPGVAIRVYHVGAKSFTVNDGIIKGGCGFSFHDTKDNTNIVINGGEFITKGGTYYKATSNEGFIITINGGTFSDNVTAACKEGYFARKGADGRYSLALISDARDDEITAKVIDKTTKQETKYFDFASAISAAQSANKGDTVVLYQDIELSQYVTITKEIVIDLNGYTISSDGSCQMIFYVIDGELSITSSKDGAQITNYGYSNKGRSIWVDYGGTILIENVDISSDCYGIYIGDAQDKCVIKSGTIFGGTYSIYAYDGNIIIEGGVFTKSIYGWPSYLTITGGTFESYIYLTDYSGLTKNYLITGGTFQGYVYLRDGNNSCYKVGSIKGGTFSGDSNNYWYSCMDTDSVYKENSDGSYTVVRPKYMVEYKASDTLYCKFNDESYFYTKEEAEAYVSKFLTAYPEYTGIISAQEIKWAIQLGYESEDIWELQEYSSDKTKADAMCDYYATEYPQYDWRVIPY